MRMLKILLIVFLMLEAVSCGSGDTTRNIGADLIPIEYKEFDFQENKNKIYGFDQVAYNEPLYSSRSRAGNPARSPDSRDSIFMSIEANMMDSVNVIIQKTANAAGYESFYVTSNSPEIVRINPENRFPVSDGTTAIALTAGDIAGQHQRAEIRIMGVSSSLDGYDVILRRLFVEVFKKREVDIFYFRVYDGRPGRDSTISSFDPKDTIEPILSKIMHQAVVGVNLITQNLNVPFDENGNGFLDAQFDRSYDTEVNIIRDFVRGIVPEGLENTEICVHINRIRAVWTIVNDIKRGTNVTITINGTRTLRGLQNASFGIGDENVRIVPSSLTDTSVKIASINRDYPAGTLLWFIPGGFSPSERDIAFVKTSEYYSNTTQRIITFTGVIAHELAHGDTFANMLDDVNESGNVMNFVMIEKPEYIFRMRSIQGTLTGSNLTNDSLPQRQWMHLQKLNY